MKRRWELAAMTCVAIMCTWLVGQSRVQAEEQEKQMRIQVTVDASEDGETAGAVKKGAFAVAVHVHGDLDKKLEGILKDAGLKGDKLQEAIDKVMKACKESRGTRMRAIRQMHMPQVTIVGPDGKQQKIELRALGGGISVGGAMDQELTEGIREKVEQALKKSGLEDAQLEHVRKALERVGQMRVPHGMMLGPQAVRVEATKILGGHEYMIGLSCAPLNDGLRSELKLADGQGLVALNVFDDTPAEKAGIKEGDVLVKVGGKDVADIQDLVGAVQNAGKEKKKLTVQLIRDGKKQTVQVVPAERDSLEISVEAEIDDDTLENLKMHLPDAAKHGVFLWKQGPAGIGELGPGVISSWGAGKVDDSAVKDLKKQVDALSRQVKELKTELKKLNADKD